MKDRKLLKLAARAAGINTDECPVFDYGVDWGGKAGIWNPLTDDGDAMRLAVKLGMNIWRGQWPSGRRYVAAHRVWSSTHSMYYDDGVSLTSDPLAATRRAIVRAAAEIGKRRHDTTRSPKQKGMKQCQKSTLQQRPQSTR